MKTQSGRARWANWAYVRFVYPLSSPQNYEGLASRLRRFEKLESLSLYENQERQWRAVIQLLQHAYHSTPYYRQRLDDAGIRPSDNLSPADLQKIPPLTREDIRNNLDELWSRRSRREDLQTAATGGTTDTPVPLLRSPNSMREKFAIQLRFNAWAGFRPGDKAFYLWGARQDFSQDPSWRWRLFDRYVMRRVWAPTSLLNEQVLESYRQMLNRFKPRIIYAYPTPLALFCEYLRDCGQSFHRPVSAISTAEPLLPHQRQVIEGVLGCRVFERYATRDFGTIAAECGCHQGLHLNPAAAYVEFLPVKGTESEGLHEILVTDLLSDGMPLIRYQINDCTFLGPNTCVCGRGYPLIQPIIGRTTDNFYLPNGDVVPGVSLTNRVIQVCPGLKKLQVIQETLEGFRVRYVPGPGFGTADIDLLRANLKRFLSDKVKCSFEPVPDIERERSGKTRFCVSYVTCPEKRRHHECHGAHP